MRALLVDDERLARAELRRLLASHPQIEIVGEASHAGEARGRIDELEPDLLFLDIEMPGEDAFDLLASLDRAPDVVFTTAFDAHAVRAFEVSALDYLLKPVDPARLAATIERALVRHPRPRDPRCDRVLVRDGRRCWLVRLDEVPVLTSEGNYVRLDAPGEPLLLRTLGYLEAHLGPAFFRASRKHLVNVNLIEHVEAAAGGALLLRMRSGKEIEMSRRQAQRFKAKLSV